MVLYCKHEIKLVLSSAVCTSMHWSVKYVYITSYCCNVHPQPKQMCVCDYDIHIHLRQLPVAPITSHFINRWHVICHNLTRLYVECRSVAWILQNMFIIFSGTSIESKLGLVPWKSTCLMGYIFRWSFTLINVILLWQYILSMTICLQSPYDIIY